MFNKKNFLIKFIGLSGVIFCFNAMAQKGQEGQVVSFTNQSTGCMGGSVVVTTPPPSQSLVMNQSNMKINTGTTYKISLLSLMTEMSDIFTITVPVSNTSCATSDVSKNSDATFTAQLDIGTYSLKNITCTGKNTMETPSFCNRIKYTSSSDSISFNFTN